MFNVYFYFKRLSRAERTCEGGVAHLNIYHTMKMLDTARIKNIYTNRSIFQFNLISCG